ncbi:hypothetical protein ACHAXH_006297 [Discostella pseudostelligera]
MSCSRVGRVNTMERIISLMSMSILLSLALSSRHVSGFSPPSAGASASFPRVVGRHHKHHVVTSLMQLMASTSSGSSSSSSSDGILSELVGSSSSPKSNENETIISKAPSLNGKIVLPVKVMAAGLKGHRVAAVYAILNSNYKRSSSGDGWEHVVHVGITKDLANDISYFTSQKGSEAVAHATMEEFANGWRRKVVEAQQQQGGEGGGQMTMGDTPNNDNLGWGMNRSEMPDVISPFETNNNNKNNATIARKQSSSPIIDDGEPLELGIENVDKVLDDVRPYLISDGGNVCVQNVDLETGNVYLLLEGACGSCASSTVTMKMGIERVLKEKFGDRLGEVIQVEPGGAGDEGAGGKPSELTIEAVQAEVNRMSAAITAMGGVVRVVSVDPIGVVEIEFRGPNRVKKGLELALLDVEFVKHVKFVS